MPGIHKKLAATASVHRVIPQANASCLAASVICNVTNHPHKSERHQVDSRKQQQTLYNIQWPKIQEAYEKYDCPRTHMSVLETISLSLKDASVLELICLSLRGCLSLARSWWKSNYATSVCVSYRLHCSSVCVVTRLRPGLRRDGVVITERCKRFLLIWVPHNFLSNTLREPLHRG